jgi:hypothetical protein
MNKKKIIKNLCNYKIEINKFIFLFFILINFIYIINYQLSIIKSKDFLVREKSWLDDSKICLFK